MMHYDELVPAQAGDLLRHADRLRLVVAAYLARFKGASRDHANSDLRCYVTGAPSAAWTRSWPGARTWSCTSAGCKRFAGSSPRWSEPEVRSWLTRLSNRDFGRVDFHVGLLADQAENLGEPYTRHLGGKVRELRFHLLAQQTRVTYWLAPAAASSS
jgi:hypothetical protein